MSGIFRYNSNITPPRRTTLSPFCTVGQDVTMENSYGMGFRSPTSFNVLPGAGGNPGNTSPGQGRSLREYDEKLHALQKENFHLKLRLFFLEEKTPSAGTSKSEDETLFKQNVDLKVENEELRKELQEKQDLLCQAAKAMELMEDSQKNSQHNDSATIADLMKKIQYLEEEIRSMEKSTSSQSVSSGVFGRPLMSADVDLKLKIVELQQTIHEFEAKTVEMTHKIKELEKLIGERDVTIRSLQNSNEDRDAASLFLPMESVTDDMDIETLRIRLANQTQRMVDRENAYQDLKEQLESKSRAHDKGCKTIQLLLIKTRELDGEIEKFKSKEQKQSSSSPNTSATLNSMKADLIRAQAEAEQANAWRKDCAEVCSVLTMRLKELAGFLDSLLKHKDVLSVLAQDRHKAMRKAVDRSLDLSRSLNNMSISGGPGRFSLNEQSLMQFSSVSELLNSSYFNASVLNENKENQNTSLNKNSVIENLQAEVKGLKFELERLSAESAPSGGLATGLDMSRKDRVKTNLSVRLEQNSESEAWSEPDRKVSHERIGLDDSVKLNTHVRSPSGKYDETSSASEEANNSRLVRKNSVLRLQEKISDLEVQLDERTKENQRLQKSLSDSEAGMQSEKESSNSLKFQLENLRAMNELLVQEMENLKAQYKQMEIEFDDRLAQCNDLARERDLKVEEIETLKASMEADLKEVREKHAKQIDAMASQENCKLELLQQQMTDKYKKALEERDRSHQICLQRDWVSRISYEEQTRQLKDIENRLGDSQALLILMRDNETEIKTQLREKENDLRTMKRSLDDATLQTSKAVLERTKVLNERDQMELQFRELQDKYDNVSLEKSELYARHAALSNFTSKMHNRIVENEEKQFQLMRSASQGNARYSTLPNPGTSSGGEQSGYTSDELKQRLDNSSPDLGIESDGTGRSSGTDANIACLTAKSFKRSPTCDFTASSTMLLEGDEEDASSPTVVPQKSASHAGIPMIVQHDCEKVEKENSELRRKLERTRRAFEKTWAQLRISNQRKEQIEKDIRQEIYKTHSVLKNVRSNIMESVGQQQQREEQQVSPPSNSTGLKNAQ